MTKKKFTPWIFPDKTEQIEPGIFAYYVLYGFESKLGLFPISLDLHRISGIEAREKHAGIVAQKLSAARGHTPFGVSIASQRQQIDRGAR